jgi:Uma2 family endonuclease
MLLTSEKRYTKEDYERLPEGAPYQLIGGELIMSPSPTFFHQEIIANILEKLRPFVRKNGLGQVALSPLDVHLTEDDIYQPDLIFIRKENLSHIGPHDRIHFVPDLVIEVLSPSTAYYDYSHKKAVYAERGVKEYWIIDPNDKTIEIMVNDGKVFRTDEFLRVPAILESAMFPGFSMNVEDVFAL